MMISLSKVDKRNFEDHSNMDKETMSIRNTAYPYKTLVRNTIHIDELVIKSIFILFILK